MQSDVTAHRPRSAAHGIVAWGLAVITVASVPACAFLDKTSKVMTEVEEAQRAESLKKPPAPLGHDEPSSRLRATPVSVDFGRVPVASDHHQEVVISNPSAFAVTVVHTTIRGCGFVLADGTGDRHVVAAQGQLVVTVDFRPAERRACSGLLLLEIDSAGGRFMEVPLKGQGV
jgi:hypothetical protein